MTLDNSPKIPPYLVVLFFWFSVLLLVLSASSCSFAKSAFKTSASSNEQGDRTGEKTSTVLDFGTVLKKDYSLIYEPINPSESMQIRTGNGEIVTATNAKVKATANTTEQQNNSYSKSASKTDESFEKEQESSTKDKDESFKLSSAIILYIVGGAVVLGLFAIYSLKQSINQNTALLTAVLNK